MSEIEAFKYRGSSGSGTGVLGIKNAITEPSSEFLNESTPVLYVEQGHLIWLGPSGKKYVLATDQHAKDYRRMHNIFLKSETSRITDEYGLTVKPET